MPRVDSSRVNGDVRADTQTIQPHSTEPQGVSHHDTAEIGALGPGAIGGLLAAQLSKAGHMRRVPFGSEAGAFRFTLGVGLVIGASVFIGWLSVPAAGLGVFAAVTVSAALSRLWVALRDCPAALRPAMSEAAAGPSEATTRPITCSRRQRGASRCRARRGANPSARHASTSRSTCRRPYSRPTSTYAPVGHRPRAARRYAPRALAGRAHEHKIVARGEMARPEPHHRTEDELRSSGGDEVIVVTQPRDRETWQERGELARLRRELYSRCHPGRAPERSSGVADLHRIRSSRPSAPRPGNSSDGDVHEMGGSHHASGTSVRSGDGSALQACQDTRGWGEQRQVTRLTRARLSPLALALVDDRQSFAYRSIAGRC